MNEQNIKDILQIILDSLQGKEFVWRLEGSANLKIQGVEVSVQDLDITTNDEGIEIFRNALKKYIVKDFFSQKINGRSIVCDINNFEIEINSYGDRELDMFDKTEKIFWNDLKIPILPLEYAKKFYELINRKEKVDLISKYLSG
jgi:hypothetical protein|tara:strand:- start:50 stop:481 length:432 start_codon:yes stop_codon:yes gene_type:complete